MAGLSSLRGIESGLRRRTRATAAQRAREQATRQTASFQGLQIRDEIVDVLVGDAFEQLVMRLRADRFSAP